MNERTLSEPAQVTQQLIVFPISYKDFQPVRPCWGGINLVHRGPNPLSADLAVTGIHKAYVWKIGENSEFNSAHKLKENACIN